MNKQLTSYVDEKQNIWFKRKEIAELLGYQDLDQVIRKNVDSEDIKTYPVSQMGEVRYQFMNQAFILSYLLQKRNAERNSKDEFQVLFSRLSENMDFINFMIIRII